MSMNIMEKTGYMFQKFWKTICILILHILSASLSKCVLDVYLVTEKNKILKYSQHRTVH